jgi:hypothetical protein
MSTHRGDRLALTVKGQQRLIASMQVRDCHGEVSLLLCESLLHLLVEEGVIKQAKALDAVETVVEVTREMVEADPASSAAARLAEALARSFRARRRR